jgi:hypothetical protein
MNWLRELARRIRMLVNRRQFDVDLEEEMRLHLELRQQDQIESGMSADDAQGHQNCPPRLRGPSRRQSSHPN